MNVSDLQYKDISRDLISSMLFENIEYSGTNSDIGIVMGSYSAVKYRVPRAVALYNKGLVKNFIFSGGKMLIDSGIYEEADIMKDFAIESGLPSSNIYTACNSHSTFESLKNAFDLLKSIEYFTPKNITLITTSFHMKRCLLLVDKMFSKDINIIPCPVNDSFTTKENWYKTPAGYERAIGEIFGIIDYANKGYINNFNITL